MLSITAAGEPVSKADDVFTRQFLMLLGLLVAFTLVIIAIARGIGGNAFEHKRQDPADVAVRIAPVGEVRIAGAGGEPAQPAAARAPAPAAAPSTVKTGEQVYGSGCMACHASGAAGAPKVGDKGAWGPRAEQGLDTLVDHAVSGQNAMPPKGGNPALSDEEIRNAVRFRLEQTGIGAS